MSKLDSKTIQKKLSFFLNEKKKTSQRLYALNEYLTISSSSKEETTTFFNNHANVIYSLILDAFSGFPDSTIDRKGKKKFPKPNDYPLFFSLFEKLLTSCHKKIKTKWQYRSFTSIMEILCSLQNNPEIRKTGIRLLLIFIDRLVEKADSQIYKVLMSSICFDTFSKEYKETRIFFQIKPNLGNNPFFF
ncbi:hypothetical protein M0813_27509 [Anaeramoeba flamelloides]|uniref:Uncharacterized protein n=1 Tax=Anaeramoeba flamelloides TaxID=1746091 RepID=A0ABQ8XXH1_9EUKA|nr:hypothetical protein M0813_27509 [Anaeramoeba flamelloides]